MSVIAPPRDGDGRGLDPGRSEHSAEAATVRGEDRTHPPAVAIPVATPAPTDTYYDLPVIKAPPWKWYVPAYFYAGGVAGASAALHGAVQLARGRGLEELAGKLRWTALAGDAIGAALLVADLGRPERFINMMRVFRPTSPMNVGTWILSAAGATSAADVVLARLGKRSRALGLAGMVAGGALATYTGVLLGNTAVPVWHQTRVELPLLFAASSAASAAALLELLGSSTRREARVVRRYSIAAKAAELVAAAAFERAAGPGVVGKPLREGSSGTLWRGARYLQMASLAATALRAPRVAGALGTASGIALRFALLAAGRASAADPRATFEPQNQMLDAEGGRG